MGETLPLFKASFNHTVQVESRPEHLTGEAGALIQREIMDRLGIIEWLGERLTDPRDPSRVTYPLADLIRTHLLLLGQGWRDRDDADRLRLGAALRVAHSSCRGRTPLQDGQGLAWQTTLSRLGENLSREPDRRGLGESIRERDGHYRRRIYHPLIASCAETGDLLDAVLRPGQVGTAEGGLDFILAQVDRCRARLAERVIVRFDAGFPEGQTLSGLEARGVEYMARIRNNAVLNAMAAPHLKRPPGRPPEQPRIWCHEHRYQAGSWDRSRRVVLVVL